MEAYMASQDERKEPTEDERRIAIEESWARVQARTAKIANDLVGWLQADGLHHNITLEDIERLAQPGKKPEFMRHIIAELLVALRPK
jgi:hypothetical protein